MPGKIVSVVGDGCGERFFLKMSAGTFFPFVIFDNRIAMENDGQD